jgi:hypothetical protein
MPPRRASLSGGAPRHRRDSRPPTSFTWRSQAVATAEAAAGGRAPCVRMAVMHDAARCGAPSLPSPLLSWCAALASGRGPAQARVMAAAPAPSPARARLHVRRWRTPSRKAEGRGR